MLPFENTSRIMEELPKKKMSKGEHSRSLSEENEAYERIDDSEAFVERFAVLFNSSEFSDIKLRVGDVSYFGHKFILASSSSVFK